MSQSGELTNGFFSSMAEHAELSDAEVKKRAHGTPRPLPGSLATASLFHPVDRHPDPDIDTQVQDRLEDLQRYEPKTWAALMETYSLPASTEVVPVSDISSNEGFF